MEMAPFALDSVLPNIMVEPRIVALLNPLPRAASAPSERPNNKRTWEGAPKGRGTKGKDSEPMGKGKGTNTSKKSGNGMKTGHVPVPKELVGLNLADDGVKRCYSFNMNRGCDRPVDAHNCCQNGSHTCIIKGCGGHHSASKCPKR